MPSIPSITKARNQFVATKEAQERGVRLEDSDGDAQAAIQIGGEQGGWIGGVIQSAHFSLNHAENKRC